MISRTTSNIDFVILTFIETCAFDRVDSNVIISLYRSMNYQCNIFRSSTASTTSMPSHHVELAYDKKVPSLCIESSTSNSTSSTRTSTSTSTTRTTRTDSHDSHHSISHIYDDTMHWGVQCDTMRYGCVYGGEEDITWDNNIANFVPAVTLPLIRYRSKSDTCVYEPTDSSFPHDDCEMDMSLMFEASPCNEAFHVPSVYTSRPIPSRPITMSTLHVPSSAPVYIPSSNPIPCPRTRVLRRSTDTFVHRDETYEAWKRMKRSKSIEMKEEVRQIEAEKLKHRLYISHINVYPMTWLSVS